MNSGIVFTGSVLLTKATSRFWALLNYRSTTEPDSGQRFAANRCRWLTNSNTTDKQIMARSGHRATAA